MPVANTHKASPQGPHAREHMLEDFQNADPCFAEIAVRLEDALMLMVSKTTPSPPPQSRASSEDIWEFDVAFADSGFHVDVREAIQVPLKSLNAELQVNRLLLFPQKLQACTTRMLYPRSAHCMPVEVPVLNA